MVSSILTASLTGVEGSLVRVEADISQGLPGFQIVGLAGASIRESWMRVRAAIHNSGLAFPARKVTVNLVPAGRPKEGSHFDLPIALSILAAGDILPTEAAVSETAYFGELSLDGNLQAVRGVLPLVLWAREQGIRRVVVPYDNAKEAALIDDVEVLACQNLAQAVAVLSGDGVLTATAQMDDEISIEAAPNIDRGEWAIGDDHGAGAQPAVDYQDILGQYAAKRAMVLCAAGGHGMLLMGSPGGGKSMLARRLPTILPPMNREEIISVTKLYSVAGLLGPDRPLISERPFRHPHHSVTKAALIGGGQNPKPGELSLAHLGVLFLDEIGEFDAKTLDAMREPLEDGTVTIARQAGAVTYPCEMIFVAATNPCRCGYYGDPRRECTCTANEVHLYQRKLSGPLLDRLDLQVVVQPEFYGSKEKSQSSEEMAMQVAQARARQKARYKGEHFSLNGQIPPAKMERYCALEDEARALLKDAAFRLGLSMRACHKIMKVARTIADVAGEERVSVAELSEALQYRRQSVLE